MLEVNIVDNEVEDIVRAGQIRYQKGDNMYVLITFSTKAGYYDAVVLSGGGCVSNFDWNSKGQSAESIKMIYPYVAEGRLEIFK